MYVGYVGYVGMYVFIYLFIINFVPNHISSKFFRMPSTCFVVLFCFMNYSLFETMTLTVCITFKHFCGLDLKSKHGIGFPICENL